MVALCGVLALTGCEAPLDLARVEQEQARPVHGFDQFKSVAASGTHVVAASDAGVLLVSDLDLGGWQRVQLPTKAAFLSVAACPNGQFTALDTRRTLWVSDARVAKWTPQAVDTQESLMALGCDSANVVWIGGSYSTLLRSSDMGESWSSTSQEDDLLFTALQFAGDGLAVAAGEFGTVMFSEDGGDSWDRADPLPNEFYPIGLHFRNRDTGWVSGLGGTILHTGDGGESWMRENTETGAPLYSFAVLDDRLFALGDNGTLLERHEGEWRRVPDVADLSAYLIGAVEIGQQQLLLAGGAGTLMPVKPMAKAGRVAGQGTLQ